MSSPERIFHYTSIDTLALILSSRKIRFSRLDRVDDAREAPTVHGIAFSKYFFVSCWTAEPEESIPQWHIYTERMTGVRLDLPAFPFAKKRLEPPAAWRDVRVAGELVSPVDMNEMFGDSYFILPACMNQNDFAAPVEYVNDVEERYAASVKMQHDDPNQPSIAIERPFDLVRLKTKKWEFQKEYRFALFVLPAIPLPPDGPGNTTYHDALPGHIATSLRSGHDPGVQFIDLDLRDEALEGLVVTTGPLCTPGQKLCVEALVDKFVSNGRVRTSELEPWVRRRGLG